MDKIQGVLLDNLVTTEGPVSVETDQLSLQVEKVTVKDAGKKANELSNSRFHLPSADVFGLEESKSIVCILICFTLFVVFLPPDPYSHFCFVPFC